MKKKIVVTIVLIIIAGGLYLNRAYAHIYATINHAGLKSPDNNQTYIIGTTTEADKNITYDALGDSLTAGVGIEYYQQSFPFLLAQKISAQGSRVTLNNRSIVGAKTNDVRKYLLPAVIQDSPDIVTVLIGTNDIHGNISRAEFKKNYEVVLQRLTQETKAKIYLINIPFIGTPGLILPPYNYYFSWRINQFNAVIKELATAYHAEYLDLYSPTASVFKQSASYYSADLFHPSAQGYALWADILYDDIN